MKKTHILILLLALLFLAGCNGGGDTTSSSNPQYYVYNDGGDIVDGGGYVPGDIGGGDEHVPYHLPEPATLALFGSGLLGLAGYALARLKGRRKR